MDKKPLNENEHLYQIYVTVYDLAKALEWYADKDNYQTDKVLTDKGKRARKVLTMFKKEMSNLK